jgi:hypothetical protein
MSDIEQSVNAVADRLRLGPGFHEKDHTKVVETLSSLDRHLAHWRPEALDLRISVKDRDTLNQRVTLEIWLPGWHSLLAHYQDRDLGHALVEVRKVMVREIEEERSKHEPHKGSAHQVH